ncbi:MAG: VOC family protein [Chloroflexi bacterium]|nr:VOC family protein [Chloroflexota bacterium]
MGTTPTGSGWVIDGIEGVILWTEDVERLAGFYRDVLGLKVHSWQPTFVAFLMGDLRLSVGKHDGVSGPAKDPFRVMVNLGVKDIQTAYAGMRAKGVVFLRPPEHEHWGGWVATFQDPDGNVLQLLQQP